MMKVLIVENEIYLAQSISNKLSDVGYSCEILNSTQQIKATSSYDVLLLSTNMGDLSKIIAHHRQSVIILLVSYISVDTVIEPIKAGASDYIQKPFMVEELIRKIKHYQHYKSLEKLNNAYFGYISSRLQKASIGSFEYKKLKLPLIIKTYKQINADAFVFNFVKSLHLNFLCVEIDESSTADSLFKMLQKVDLLFLSNAQNFKALEGEKFFNELGKKPIIIHTNTDFEGVNVPVIDLNDKEQDLYSKDILTIDEYMRYVIVNYQDSYSDTDLSKSLGISRKSLWEKRKRYGLIKKK